MGTIRYALRRYLLVDHQYPFRLTWSLVTCDGSREAREDKGAESEHRGAAGEHRGSIQLQNSSVQEQSGGVEGHAFLAKN